jgi:bifunctional non-homologous end joining protein LigD
LRRRRKAGGGLKCRSALIDGEAVVLDEKGISQFPAPEKRRSDAIVFMAFDLVSLDGADLRHEPLAARQRELRKVVGKGSAHIRVAEPMAGGGRRVFEQAVAAGAEGIVAKDKTARYGSERSRSWLKIKGYPRADVFIVGCKPSTRTQTFASLHPAIEEEGELRHVGGLGAGCTEAQRAAISPRYRAAPRSDRRPISSATGRRTSNSSSKRCAPKSASAAGPATDVCVRPASWRYARIRP